MYSQNFGLQHLPLFCKVLIFLKKNNININKYIYYDEY